MKPEITTTEIASAAEQGTLDTLRNLRAVLQALNSIAPSAELDAAIATITAAMTTMVATTTEGIRQHRKIS